MSDLNSVSVCAIDDDAAHLKTFGRLLELADKWEVEYSSFQESKPAFEAFKNHSFDLIVLDYSIGPECGLDVLKKIRNIGIDWPVIIMSGNDHQDIVAECIDNGANDYIVKGSVDVESMIDSFDLAISQHATTKSVESQ
jgi:DNA-binding NtrC family response regulator